MRLVSLEANDPRFRSVRFNESGLTVILGQQQTPNDDPRRRTNTYNGVGKSLLIELLHFCLASSGNDAFKKHLRGWVFTLTIAVNGREHSISRSAGNPNEIAFDGEKVSLAKLKSLLLSFSFDIQSPVAGLKFRSLLSPFLRSGRAAYERFDRATGADAKNEYYALLRNAFLLGLDTHLIDQKRRLRTRQTQLTKTMKQLESDPLFAELLASEKASLELTQLREDERLLEEQLRAFQVADNYREIQQEADGVKRELERARREFAKTEDALAQIERSLVSRGDISPEAVERVYSQAKIAFPDLVRQRVDEVVRFQAELTGRRVYRLTSEREQLERKKRELEKRTKGLATDLERRLRYLGSHVALDEYLAVNDRLNELRTKIARLEASNDQRAKVNKEQRAISLSFAEQDIAGDDYLERSTALMDEANNLFRSFTIPLYGHRTSGIAVTNDSGENLTRYKIEAHIPRDAAEGINEAKIFCYDLTILLLRRGHRIEFLMHDSSLFSPVDHRQRLTMLQLADGMAREHRIQYICTLNHHDVTSMAPVEERALAEFNKMFSEPNVVLRLGDCSPKERLLGMDVDMNYWTKSETRPDDDDESELGSTFGAEAP